MPWKSRKPKKPRKSRNLDGRCIEQDLPQPVRWVTPIDVKKHFAAAPLAARLYNVELPVALACSRRGIPAPSATTSSFFIKSVTEL